MIFLLKKEVLCDDKNKRLFGLYKFIDDEFAFFKKQEDTVEGLILFWVPILFVEAIIAFVIILIGFEYLTYTLFNEAKLDKKAILEEGKKNAKKESRDVETEED
uniref:DUF4342 domain-containing protein n=1 Tax=Parastrongyloides trichosuri TaxID=131310 RepID=A0A0N4ZP82_PARTI